MRADTPVPNLRFSVCAWPRYAQLAKSPGMVISFGSFDGLTCGQLDFARRMARSARRRGLPTGILVFRPRPLETFRSHQRRPFLFGEGDTLQLLAQAGVDHPAVLKFTQRLTISPFPEFLDRLLRRAPVSEIWIGRSASLGRGAQGRLPAVRRACKARGIRLVTMNDSLVHDERSKLGEFMATGNIAGMREVCCTPPRLVGITLKPERRGSVLNLGFGDTQYVPPVGEYEVAASIVANASSRGQPKFELVGTTQLEVRKRSARLVLPAPRNVKASSLFVLELIERLSST